MSEDPKELVDTNPLSKSEIEDLLGVTEAEEEVAKRKLPDPAIVRACVVVGLIFLGAALGKPELKDTWVDPIMSGFTVAAPIGLAFWLKHHHPRT